MRQVTTLAMVAALLVAATWAGVGLGAVGAGAANTPTPTPHEPDEGGNETAAFGQPVSNFVHSLQDENGTDGPMGRLVADFVLANNPAAAVIPAHAGPPENNTWGPPENVTQGPPANATTGPPAHVSQGPPEKESAGPAATVTQGPLDDAGSSGNATASGGGGGGPPADRGTGDDDRSEGSGPLDHAGRS